jgi:hypothetical protein
MKPVKAELPSSLVDLRLITGGPPEAGRTAAEDRLPPAVNHRLGPGGGSPLGEVRS